MSAVAEEKFSLLTYAHQRIEQIHKDKRKMIIQEQESVYDGFYNLVEELRNYLAAFGGKSEEERVQYGEILNKAIIGFPEERKRLLAMIQDQLIKKRIHDIPPPNAKYQSLAEAIFSELIGLNIIELILKDRQGLEEIQVVGKQVFEVRNGEVKPSQYAFKSVVEVERIQQNLLLFNQETMNPRKKWSEAMMSDGSRVTLTGFGFTAEPTLTIRLYTMQFVELKMLCQATYGTLDETMLLLLRALVQACFNMVVIGSTNTGKTNLIKALIAEMPKYERIVTIESRRELMLNRDFPDRNIIEYEIDEEEPQHSSKQAFKLALRQSPKRIVCAEIRDEDANIYVRACTRGHEGSITSLHASALEDVPEVITDMCMLDQRGMNPQRLTKRIASYVTNIGLEMALVKGQRKLVRIVEYELVDEQVRLRDLVIYDDHSQKWHFPEAMSVSASKKIARQAAESYEQLLTLGLVQA